MTLTAVLGALVIFVLRIASVSLGTIRQIVVVRGHRFVGAVCGFFEILIFLLAISRVIQDIDNWLELLAYCTGFSVGTVVGAVLEEQLALGYMLFRIVTEPQQAAVMAHSLRAHGFGVTALAGSGQSGPVAILQVVARRRDEPALNRLVREIDPRAFMVVAEAYRLQRGVFQGTGTQ